MESSELENHTTHSNLFASEQKMGQETRILIMRFVEGVVNGCGDGDL